MAKSRQVFVCRTCGAAQARWMGKCPDCGAWDALEEQRIDALAELACRVGKGAFHFIEDDTAITELAVLENAGMNVVWTDIESAAPRSEGAVWHFAELDDAAFTAIQGDCFITCLDQRLTTAHAHVGLVAHGFDQIIANLIL